MSEKRFHPQWHQCPCGVPYQLLVSKSPANPGREFYVCQNKKQDDPSSGCAHKFCWADEYPQGFEKKFGGGGGRGGGGFRGGRGGGSAAPAPRQQYSGFASSPQPTQVPQPDFSSNKRQRLDEAVDAMGNALSGQSHASIEMLNEVLQNLETYKKDLLDEIGAVRDLVATVGNDIVSAIKQASEPKEMEV
jgi:hypothetical protein